MTTKINQLSYWNSTMQLIQDSQTVHLEDSDIAQIVAERFNLKDFWIDDLINALQAWEQEFNPPITIQS